MTWYCSEITQGFYSSDLKSRYESTDSWPNDAIKITNDQYKALKKALSSGGKKFTVSNGSELNISSVFTNEDLLKQAKVSTSRTIRASFESAVNTPVLIHSAEWNGGMDSALSIDGAIRLAEQAGATDITLFDAANNDHLVDIATGKTIAAAIGIDYQTKFAQKQQLMRAIASASTETELDAIAWS